MNRQSKQSKSNGVLCLNSDAQKVLKTKRALRSEMVVVKCYSRGDINASFSGYRQSGQGDRDQMFYAHDELTDLKAIRETRADPPSCGCIA